MGTEAFRVVSRFSWFKKRVGPESPTQRRPCGVFCLELKVDAQEEASREGVLRVLAETRIGVVEYRRMGCDVIDIALRTRFVAGSVFVMAIAHVAIHIDRIA